MIGCRGELIHVCVCCAKGEQKFTIKCHDSGNNLRNGPNKVNGDAVNSSLIPAGFFFS